MNKSKIEKVMAEIEKMKAKISDFQSKLRELEREKIRLENEDIVALVRSEKISDAELNALMRSLRKDEPPAAEAVTSGQITNKEEPQRAIIEEN